VLRDRLVRRDISDRDSPSRKYILRILPNHHERGLAPEHESRRGLVHAVLAGGGADERSKNEWWLDPEA